MRLRSALLPYLAAAWNFNFGSFGKDESILIYGDGFDQDSIVYAGLWDLNLEADVMNYIPLENCEVLHQDTFENSDEFLPLTQSGYYFLACETDSGRYVLFLSGNSKAIPLEKMIKIGLFVRITSTKNIRYICGL